MLLLLLFQFVTQCVANWKRPIKRPHVFKIGYCEILAKVSRQPARQIIQYGIAIHSNSLQGLFHFIDYFVVLDAGRFF